MRLLYDAFRRPTMTETSLYYADVVKAPTSEFQAMVPVLDLVNHRPHGEANTEFGFNDHLLCEDLTNTAAGRGTANAVQRGNNLE